MKLEILMAVGSPSGTNLNLIGISMRECCFNILLGVGLLEKGAPELVCVGRMDKDELAIVSWE